MNNSDLLKRKGRVIVYDSLDITYIKHIFTSFYPINIERTGFNNLTYYGYSEHFEITKGEGFEIPQYVPVITQEPIGKFTVSFDKAI